MAEDQRPRPPLQEIPNRPLRSLGENVDEEGKILSLIKSIKENLDVKMLVLRKDLDRQTHDEIARDISVFQEKMEKLRSSSEDSHAILTAKIAGLGESLMEKVDAKLASLKSELDVKESDDGKIEIAQIHEELEAARTDGQLARASLSARVEGLAVKIDAIAAAPAEAVAHLKQSVEASLKQVQGLVTSFDLPAFVNEIRQLYSEKLAHADEKLKALTAHIAAIEQENEQLKKAIGEKELQLKQATTSKIDQRQTMAPGPGPSQSQSGRVARITSPRAQVRDLAPEPATSLDDTLPDSSAQKKGASFCINCGKQRQTTYSQFCIFCGSAFP